MIKNEETMVLIERWAGYDTESVWSLIKRSMRKFKLAKAISKHLKSSVNKE
jgi:hypothetical protein